MANTLPKARAGIFGFLISEADHMYLGASMDIDKAIDQLLEELRCNKALHYELQQDWKTYGEDEIDITILEELPSEEENPEILKELLQRWLQRIPYADEI